MTVSTDKTQKKMKNKELKLFKPDISKLDTEAVAKQYPKTDLLGQIYGALIVQRKEITIKLKQLQDIADNPAPKYKTLPPNYLPRAITALQDYHKANTELQNAINNYSRKGSDANCGLKYIDNEISQQNLAKIYKKEREKLENSTIS